MMLEIPALGCSADFGLYKDPLWHCATEKNAADELDVWPDEAGQD